MTKPVHHRPFNIEHAKAGAPVAMLNGWPFEIFKWDSRHSGQPILGICGTDDRMSCWTADGRYGMNGQSSFDLVMVPLGYIDGKPVFVGDEIEDSTGLGDWSLGKAGPRNRDFTRCRWPAPAKVYPETRMDAVDLCNVHYKAGINQPLRAIANAALRHAIDAGQVVLPDDTAPTKEAYDQCNHDLGKAERLLESLGYRSAGNGEWTPPADRSARDMAIAEAVRAADLRELDAFVNSNAILKARFIAERINGRDLAAIIAKVAP